MMPKFEEFCFEKFHGPEFPDLEETAGKYETMGLMVEYLLEKKAVLVLANVITKPNLGAGLYDELKKAVEGLEDER